MELQGRYGNVVETIYRHAFDNVLKTSPDVLLTWDHNTLHPLARTTAGNLELSVNAHGLRFFASCTPRAAKTGELTAADAKAVSDRRKAEQKAARDRLKVVPIKGRAKS